MDISSQAGARTPRGNFQLVLCLARFPDLSGVAVTVLALHLFGKRHKVRSRESIRDDPQGHAIRTAVSPRVVPTPLYCARVVGGNGV